MTAGSLLTGGTELLPPLGDSSALHRSRTDGHSGSFIRARSVFAVESRDKKTHPFVAELGVLASARKIGIPFLILSFDKR